MKEQKNKQKSAFGKFMDRWWLPLMLIPMVIEFLAALISFFFKFRAGQRRASLVYDTPGKPKDDGKRITLEEVDRLRVVPLVEYYSNHSGFATEPGVSYFVQAGQTTILFDLGLNGKHEVVSPLLRNAAAMGLDLSKVNFVFNSHPHPDHLNGWKNFATRQVKLHKNYDPLYNKTFFATVPLRLKQGRCVTVKEPLSIARGAASTGPLPRQLVMGYVEEQALVIKVAGKGLAVIVGCGHPGIEVLVERAEQVFQTPVFAVIGGFHFPVTDDRAKIGPLKMQKLLGNPELPWKAIDKAAVYKTIDYLKAKNIQIVAPSPHDSCDWSLGEFLKAFGDRYVPVRVGREIEILGQSFEEVLTAQDAFVNA